MDIRPYTIAIPDEQLAELSRRLRHTRWPTPSPRRWDDGADFDFMQQLMLHWQETFDWRVQEARLNQLPQYRARIDGLEIHFIHQPGTGPQPLPLVLTHGWPGSFIEMERLVPLLTDPGAHGADPADAFHVVVPSLPGFGFSDPAARPGMSSRQIARAWAALMTGLGYTRFGAQGGDIGAGVSTWLGFDYPERVLGLHLNYIPGSFRPPLGQGEPPVSLEEQAFLERSASWSEEENGYGHLQGTRPQTLAYGLSDSPTGLAAWIAEKFHAWTDGEGLGVSTDTVLTNIALYWLTNTLGSSVRLYRENRQQPLHFGSGKRVQPPLSVALFPRELPMPPRSWVERVYNVQRWTPMPRGGHFAALEEPELLAADIRAAFRPMRLQR
ncbi:epoxide hydrolase family protein [Deinococcus sp. QL22]|uniref:epoxide hydrolase family protein n=1 Tax=Deinococcus sp. QL22 TaxID=2939437 RepID=UPI0020175FD7|nr:epoxide hydrolase family protein [Deinococcus sp. QL22]UQN09285.1 epoxide hydrolase [Deinococcus sp. QL22]